MYLNFQQEAFSRAYLHAVVAAAGFKYQDGPLPDDDGVDVTISAKGAMGTVRSPKLDVQVKCQLGPALGDPIKYKLRARDYELLRHQDYGTVRILAVVFVPENVSEWTDHSEERLLLSRCGYWASLRGHPEVANTATVTVSLPRKNVLSVAGLEELMAKIGRKEEL